MREPGQGICQERGAGKQRQQRADKKALVFAEEAQARGGAEARQGRKAGRATRRLSRRLGFSLAEISQLLALQDGVNGAGAARPVRVVVVVEWDSKLLVQPIPSHAVVFSPAVTILSPSAGSG